jgi:hypothetical protein
VAFSCCETRITQSDKPLDSSRLRRDKESNWLPAPKKDFNLVLRSYLPGPEIQEQHWAPPTVNRVN